MLLLSDLVVFVEPSSNMNEFALIVMVVKDSLDGFGFPFLDESNQILLLILLLHLDMIVKLSEGSFESLPVICGVIMGTAPEDGEKEAKEEGEEEYSFKNQSSYTN